jgi:hypothetical protein
MKYQQNQKVMYNGKKAKVLTGWKAINGDAKYTIEILGEVGKYSVKTVTTTEDKLKECEGNPWADDDVKPYGYINPEVKCPKCGCEWKITKFGNNVWYDCTYCNKTKEQILKTYNSKSDHSRRNYFTD